MFTQSLGRIKLLTGAGALTVLIGTTTAAQPTEPHLFIANENNVAPVQEFNLLDGGFKKSVGHDVLSTDGSGRSLAFDGRGWMWVGDDATRSLYRFDCAGTLAMTVSGATDDTINDIEYWPVTDLIYYLQIGPSAIFSRLMTVRPETGIIEGPLIEWDSSFQPDYMAFGPDGLLYITRWDGDPVAGKIYDPSSDFAFVGDIPLPGYVDPEAFRGTGIAFVGDHFYIGGVDGLNGGAGWIVEYNLADATGIGHDCAFEFGIGALERASDATLWAGATGGVVFEMDIATCEILQELDSCIISPDGNADIELYDVGDWNNNGIRDVCEIAAGLLADENHNWIPDFCEVCGSPADLNGDGVVNILDLLELLARWDDC
jgi:hypothetical protein